jgi:hypothetical protein
MLLLIGGIAYVFFKNEGVKVKLPVFGALLIGVTAFAIALSREATNPTYFISGHISDSDSSDPIDEAEVILTWGPSTQTMSSDSDGKYSFLITPDASKVPRQLTLQATKTGYKKFVRTVDNPFYKMPQDLKMHILPMNPNQLRTQAYHAFNLKVATKPGLCGLRTVS